MILTGHGRTHGATGSVPVGARVQMGRPRYRTGFAALGFAVAAALAVAAGLDFLRLVPAMCVPRSMRG